MSSSAKKWTGLGNTFPPKVNNFLNEKSKLKIGSNVLKVIETPGHTPGSISFYNSKNKLVLVGDLVFSDGSFGRTDFKYSDKNLLASSINKILKLPGETQVFSGHGEDSNIFKLKTLLNP